MTKSRVQLEDLELMELRYINRNTGRSEVLCRVPRVGEFLWLSGSAESESPKEEEELVRVVRVIHDLRRSHRILLDVETVSVNPVWNWPVPAPKGE
jgi:hypothetical protein